MDRWTGIEGIVRLPTPEFDPARVREGSGRYLDNASIYVGGRSATNEIDAGLSWEVVREADGSVSRMAKAFRPFWRNEKWASGPAKPEYYFHPGDRVKMRCEVTTEPGKLRLEIQLLSRASNPATTETPELRARRSDPLSSLSVVFDARSFGPDELQEFKRVNAIDQSGNEGKSAAPTRASVSGAEWEEVWLLRGNTRVPMTSARFTDMRCPSPANVEVSPGKNPLLGGERISIRGTAETGSR